MLMNMAINVYEYGREGKCVYMFIHRNYRNEDEGGERV